MEQIKALYAAMAEVSATSTMGAASVSVPAREVWAGALWEFVEQIIAENKHGRTGTGWERQAVMKAAKGFDVMDKRNSQCKPLSGKNAWQAWKNKMNDETPHK